MPPSTSLQPELDIQLFGRFLTRIDGQEVGDQHWPRRSAKTLVKLLALSPAHTLHREQIINALWPKLPLQTAANNLDKAIHGARRALEPALAKGAHSRFILTPRNQVILASPGALKVDALRFEQAANHALRRQDAVAARQSLQLHAGALLVDELFEEWTLMRRDALRQLFRATTVSAAELFAQHGDHTSGIELARRLLHEDAADEHAHLLVMRMHAGSGRAEQALMQFEQCRRALLAAGLEPGPEISQLHRHLRDERARPRATAAPPQLPFAAGWAPRIVPITFRSGIIHSARTTPDGRQVVLTANWDPGASALYRLSPHCGQVERLLMANVEPFAVAASGHLLIGLEPQQWNYFNSVCTLAIQPASGAAPVVLLEGVQCADLHPRLHWQYREAEQGGACGERGESGESGESGKAVDAVACVARRAAIVREVHGMSRLEFPIGHVLFETGGWLSHPRFSADGRYIAFIEHPIPMDDEGHVMVLDLADPQAPVARCLTQNFLTIQGLSWRQGQVWFTGSRRGATRSLYGVDLAGAEHPKYHGLGNLTLLDSTADGRLLVSAARGSTCTFARHASDTDERDITWHERTAPRDISADGRTLLIEEGGTGGRHHYVAYLRGIDGASTRMVADGVVPLVLSPDGRRAIVRVPARPSRLAVLDLASGTQTPLPNDEDSPLVHTEFVSFFPSGDRIAFSATDGQGGMRIYTQHLPAGRPVCFAPDQVGLRMLSNRSVAPDGLQILLLDAEHRLCLHPLAGGGGVPLPGLPRGFSVITWGETNDHLFVHRWNQLPSRIYRYRLADAHMQEWLALSPRQLADAKSIPSVRLSPDGRSYAYGVKRESTDLYLFEEG